MSRPDKLFTDSILEYGLLWLVFMACIMSATAGLFLGVIAGKSGPQHRMASAMGWSCGFSFLYRTYLLFACISNRYHQTYMTPAVHLILFVSGFATTVFYALIIAASLHSFLAVARQSNEEYDNIAMGEEWIKGSILVGVVGAVCKWFVYPRSLGKARLTQHRVRVHWLFFEYSPIEAKPLNFVNVFLLLIIGFGCPVFLTWVLGRCLRIRREAKKVLDQGVKCTITRKHIIRLILAIVGQVFMSVSSLLSTFYNMSRRSYHDVNLLVPPTAKELLLRYCCNCCTGLFILDFFLSGEGLNQSYRDAMKHERNIRDDRPCDCRICLEKQRVDIGFMAAATAAVDSETGAMDIFSLLKASRIRPVSPSMYISQAPAMNPDATLESDPDPDPDSDLEPSLKRAHTSSASTPMVLFPLEQPGQQGPNMSSDSELALLGQHFSFSPPPVSPV